MKLAFALLELALTLGVAFSAPLPQPSRALLKKFTSLVVFGDSYTDNGVRSYKPPVPAESTKRSTGGRVWPSYIRQYTGANIYDYAWSGAVCDAVVANTVRNGIKQNQIPTFLEDNIYVSDITGQPTLINPPDETVYAIWIGTNDIGYGGFLTEVQPAGMSLTYMTDCVYAQLDRLYAIGARAFVLMNMAPLDLTPLYALPQNGGSLDAQYWTDKAAYDSNITRSSEKMRQYVTMVNAIYDYQTPYDVVVANRYPHSRFAVYDVHALMTDIWENPSQYLNGTVPYNVTSSVYRCGSPCTSNAVRDSYLWYDDLHPSEQTDRIIAREFVNIVRGKIAWILIHAILSRSAPSPSLPWLRYDLHKVTSLGDNVTVLPTETAILPQEDVFRASYNRIEFLKAYFSHIQSPHIQQRFKAELLHPIEEFQALVTTEYTLLFKDAFPHRVNEAAGLPEPQRAQAREGVNRLLRKLDMLNGNITAWAYQNAKVDLRQVDARENILTQGEAIWARRFRSIKEDIDALLEQFSYYGQPLQYVGSLCHGTRGRHKGKSAINMDDFDVDLFVVHAEEWRRHLPVIRDRFPENFSNGKIYPLGTHMHELQNLSHAVGHALAANLTGRVGKSWRFIENTEIVLREIDAY
ncbi:hypothetical protein KXW98_007063 [Aspergillus fumigatus]|nr:hypothetical protein CNMCM8686_007369 [Aspergillus fumigatus]KAH1289499.1 hypothetical protein KXX30_006871 [Aspergillus fumigatus]KAH1290739.1 hypothetical protein KXX48_007720 [Aspergillus fumigatus]KAH1313334.1 hypothetical protein KXX66_007696 [Aspergillus fumigatus]KAH1356183.1 hypothetical protein KXX33_007316 [Aspergillus fumigatus]